MANIILTNECNLNCPFCFATENNFSKTNFKKEEFRVSDVVELSGFIKGKTYRLCGGEPTINSNIIDIMDRLFSEGYSILLMSNALWPEKFINYIKKLSGSKLNRINYLFNILEGDHYTLQKYQKLETVLSIINPARTSLGLTIYKRQFEYKYLIKLANRFSIKSIRASIAAPNLDGNEYALEEDYYSIANRLHQFLIESSKTGIKVHKDCNYIPPCYFTDEQLLDIKFSLSNNWNFTCASSPIDIDLEGNAWRCYGLYSLLRVKISDFKDETTLRKYFNRRMRLISNNFFAYEECKDCSYWQKSCLGGCFTVRIKKALTKNPKLVLVPVDDDELILNCMPKKSNSLVVKEYDTRTLVFHENTLLDESDSNVITFLNTINGKLTIKDLINKWSSNFDSYQETWDEVVSLCRDLFERDIIDIIYDYKIPASIRPKNLNNVTNKEPYKAL